MPELYKIRSSTDNYDSTHTTYCAAFSSHTHLAMTQVLWEESQFVVTNDTSTKQEHKSPCFQLNFQQEAHNQVNKYTQKRLINSVTPGSEHKSVHGTHFAVCCII